MDELNELSDSDLVSLCIKTGNKDDRPFIELIQRHTTFVNRILWRYFPSDQDVEDLTQEVFFKIYRSMSQFEHRSSLKTWIFSVATNTAKNELRRRNRRPELLDQIEFEAESLLGQEIGFEYIEDTAKQKMIEQAFNMLSSQDMEILTLKDKMEMTYQEISSQLGITKSAAKMRVQRARLVLKNIYQEMLNEN